MTTSPSSPVWERLKADRARAYRRSWALRAFCGGPVRRWAELAACACTQGPVRVSVCERCPVRLDCLRAAVAEEMHEPREMLSGIRGGLTVVERHDLYEYARAVGLMPPRRSTARVAECGTDAGYNRHLDLGETACDECKAAHARKEADRRAARRRHRDQLTIPTELPVGLR